MYNTHIYRMSKHFNPEIITLWMYTKKIMLNIGKAPSIDLCTRINKKKTSNWSEE